MKKLLSVLFLSASVVTIAQPKKDPKMAAALSPGYYCNLKGDTVKGQIQTNPLNGEFDFYKGFNFKAKGPAKVVAISTKKAKRYGFDGRDFTLIPLNGGESYVEYLAKGRLNLFEYKYPGTKAGEPSVESIYFIQDTKADETNKDLRELKTISEKFYKRDIKPYFAPHPELWTDLDKFSFNKETLANAIRDFNRNYDTSASTKTEVETEKVTDEDTEVKE